MIPEQQDGCLVSMDQGALGSSEGSLSDIRWRATEKGNVNLWPLHPCASTPLPTDVLAHIKCACIHHTHMMQRERKGAGVGGTVL